MKPIHKEICHVCGIEMSANCLSRHIKKHHGIEEYNKYKQYLEQRLNNIKEQSRLLSIQHKHEKCNGKTLSCVCCNKEFVNITSLLNHIKKEHFDQYDKLVDYYTLQDQNNKNQQKLDSLNKAKTVRSCFICNELFPSKQIASHIKHKHGLENYNKFKDLLNQEKQDKLNQKSICPICGEQNGGLLKHVFYKHGISKKQFRLNYPNIKLGSKTRIVQNIKCNICNKIYKYNNGYVLHLKRNHQTEYLKYKQKSQQNLKHKHYTCAICNFNTNNLYNHIVEYHNDDITWIEYCNQYNHNINQKVYFSPEHRQKLSIKTINRGISNSSNRSYYFQIKKPRISKSC